MIDESEELICDLIQHMISWKKDESLERNQISLSTSDEEVTVRLRDEESTTKMK